jgi:hypothetical protein
MCIFAAMQSRCPLPVWYGDVSRCQVREEEDRAQGGTGPAGLLHPSLSRSVTAWTRMLQTLYIDIRKCYATGCTACRADRAVPYSVRKVLYHAMLEKTQASPRAYARCVPSRQPWAASVVDDTRAPLGAYETCSEAMIHGPGGGEKPRRHTAGLLRFDDTVQCPVRAPGRRAFSVRCRVLATVAFCELY